MWFEDFSEYVSHFTKPVPPKSEYDNQMSILSTRRLIAANPFGMARKKAPDKNSQRTVCFSEVPLHCLDRIAARRSRYGIGFSKKFAASKGALPIWYVEKGSDQHEALDVLMSGSPIGHPVWNLLPRQ